MRFLLCLAKLRRNSQAQDSARLCWTLRCLAQAWSKKIVQQLCVFTKSARTLVLDLCRSFVWPACAQHLQNVSAHHRARLVTSSLVAGASLLSFSSSFEAFVFIFEAFEALKEPLRLSSSKLYSLMLTGPRDLWLLLSNAFSQAGNVRTAGASCSPVCCLFGPLIASHGKSTSAASAIDLLHKPGSTGLVPARGRPLLHFSGTDSNIQFLAED